ncbi:MAG: flagellar hook-length control protein FliK [Sterolibacterium sp.]|nr:flagellar hook-length control protein FliK [Sterolibacterium sp.]
MLLLPTERESTMPEIASAPLFSALAPASGQTTAASHAASRGNLPEKDAQGSFASILKQQTKSPASSATAATPPSARETPANTANNAAQDGTATRSAGLADTVLPLPQAQDTAQHPLLSAETTTTAIDTALSALASEDHVDDNAAGPFPQFSQQITNAAADAQAAAGNAQFAGMTSGQPMPTTASTTPTEMTDPTTGEQSAAHSDPVMITASSASPSATTNNPAVTDSPDQMASAALRAAPNPLTHNTEQTTSALPAPQRTPPDATTGVLDNNSPAKSAEIAGTAVAGENAAHRTSPHSNGTASPPENFAQLLAATQAGQAPAAPPHVLRDSLVRGDTPGRLDSPLGSSAWHRELGDKLVWMVGRQEQRAELVLNPPQLGRVEISLNLRGDQASANFMAVNPAVREALENALPRLREMFAEAGLSLGQAQVGADSGNHAAGQSFANSGNGEHSSRFFSALEDHGDVKMAHLTNQGTWLRQGRGMVDTFA